ncbi:hypothetical protein RB195_016611 [Necator americanus]|uniref:Histone H2A/H2B/H3 domain-containing protein n=1 Tax=Necator americanus TaxID=51031 RepID=A0ABR1C4H7_NECAM
MMFTQAPPPAVWAGHSHARTPVESSLPEIDRSAIHCVFCCVVNVSMQIRIRSRRFLRTKQRRKEVFTVHIYRVLKRIHPTIGITRDAMSFMDYFVVGAFKLLAAEAARLARNFGGGKITISEIQTAVWLMLSPEIAKNAVSEGKKAVTMYSSQE